MFSEKFRKRVAKLLVTVMLFCNVSPAFAMQAVRPDYQVTVQRRNVLDDVTKTMMPALMVEAYKLTEQMVSGVATMVYQAVCSQMIMTAMIAQLFTAKYASFIDIEGLGRVRVDENNSIVLDATTISDPTKTVAFTTDRSVVLDTLACDCIKITAPNVTVRGNTFVKSLDISLDEGGVFAVDTGSKLTIESAVIDGTIYNHGNIHFTGNSGLISNESTVFNYGVIDGNSYTLENIGSVINQGTIHGQSISLQSNFLQNDGTIGGTESILDFMVHKSVINNSDISGKRAKVVLTSDEREFLNKGSIDISNTELQISGTFKNEGTSELGTLTGFVSKLFNQGTFESNYASLAIDTGENHHILKLASLMSNGDFLNTFTDYHSAMRVESILGTGKFFNRSAFEMLGAGVFGIREFYNQNAEFVARYGVALFGNAVRFVSSLGKIVNEGTLSADRFSFEDTETVITNTAASVIKASREITGKIRSFDNLGGLFSERSFISLIFDTFVHRGNLKAAKGVSFTGKTLRNYADLSLHSSKIDRIFNGESIIDEVDDVFFAEVEKFITTTATDIAVMPLDQRREAITDILQKAKTMNMMQEEIAKVQAYFNVLDAASVSPTYSPIYHMEQVHSWTQVWGAYNGGYSLWNQFATDPKTGVKTYIQQYKLHTNEQAAQVTQAQNVLNHQTTTKNTELEVEYKLKLDALEASPFPIAALAKIISVYNKRSIPKTSANLWMFFGSTIGRIENTGHVQFITGLHSIDTYMGTTESELLLPKLDTVTIPDTEVPLLTLTEPASPIASQTSDVIEDPDSATRVFEKKIEGAGKIQASKHSYHDIASAMTFNLAGDIDIHTSTIPTAFPAFSGNMSIVAKLNGFTNTQEIDLQKIRLVLDLMGMDFTNAGSLICKELSVENCGIFQNSSEIISIGDIKIRARQAINIANPVFSATPPPSCHTRRACIAQDLSPILARCKKLRGQTRLVSQDGAIDIEATECIKNHYSYMFSKNGYRFTSNGHVLSNTGYIHSLGEEPSYITSKSFEITCDTPFSIPVCSMHGGQYYCNFGYESSERAQFFCGGDIYLNGLTSFAVKGSDLVSGGTIYCNGEIQNIDCAAVYNNSASVKAKGSVFLNGRDLGLRGVMVLAGREAIFTSSRTFHASGTTTLAIPQRVQQTDISISDLLASYGNVISHGHFGYSPSMIPSIGGMKINPIIFGQIPNLENAIFDPVTYSIPFALSLLQEQLGLDSLNPMGLFRTLNQNSSRLPTALDSDTMPDESFIYFKQKGSKQLALTDGTTEEKPILSPVIHISESQLQAAHDLSIELMRLKNGGIRTIDGDTVIAGAGSALLKNFKIHSGKKAIISSDRSVRIDNSEVVGETVLIQAKADPTLDRSTGKVLSTASILKATKDKLVLSGEGGVETSADFKITDHFSRNGRATTHMQTAEILPMVLEAPEDVVISGGESAIRGTLVRTKKFTDDTIRLFAGVKKATLHYHAHDESSRGFWGGKSSIDHYGSYEIAALSMLEVEEMLSRNGQALIFESVIAEGLQKLHVEKQVFKEIAAVLHSHDEVKTESSGFSLFGLGGAPSIPKNPLVAAFSSLSRASNSKAVIAEAIKTAASIYGTVDDAKNLIAGVMQCGGLDTAAMIGGVLAKRCVNLGISFGSTTTTTTSHKTQQLPNQISAELIKLDCPTSVHLQGHHRAREMRIDTASFTTTNIVNTATVESKTESSGGSFNPVSAIASCVMPTLPGSQTIGIGSAVMGAVSGSVSDVTQTQKQTMRTPTTVIADRFILRAGNAHLTDTQIRAKLVDAIIRNDLVIESLTDEFFSETTGESFSTGLGFLGLVNGIQNLADAARVTSGMGGSVIDIKEIDRRVNAFASIVGEEQFNLIVGGTLLARSAFYGQMDEGQTVTAPRMSVESTDPREHIEVGNAVHETVAEEHSRQDNSFTIPIGDLFTVLSRRSPREQLAKTVFEQEKTAGASNAEAREVVTETKKIAEVAEKADQKVAIKEKQAAVKLRQVLVEKSPDLAMKAFSMDDAELFVFMSEYSQYHRDSISSEFLMLDAIFQRQQQQIYADAQRQFEAMSLSEKARHYALEAKDATVEYTSEFADDPLGHSKDLALGTAYFAGDLITPGGLDAPTRFLRGETSLGQAFVDQSLSVGTEMAAGFAMGKVLKVGKRLGTALVKGESTLAKAIVAKIAERQIGKVETYGRLRSGAPKGGFADGLQAHHIPSKSFMKKYGVYSDDGLAVLMTKEQHALTRTYTGKRPIQLNPRSELAADLWDVRTILRQDGVYTPQMNRDLMRGTSEFRQRFPDIFKKAEKK